MRFTFVLSILFVAASITVDLPSPVKAGDSWEGCRPGPFRAGFATREQFDYSRTFREKVDDAGQAYTGERARPVQICIWYPISKTIDDDAVVFGEYVFPAPEDYRFFSFVSEIQNREVRNILGAFRGDARSGLDIQNRRMHAVRDAEPFDSTFPVIIYHPGIRNNIAENAFLCEYLAGHGYVVAATHSVGASSQMPEPNPRDLEAMIRDREFVMAYLFDQPYADMKMVGVVGRGTGAAAAAVMQMRNDYVEVAALLDPPVGDNHFYDFAAAHPDFDTWQADVPYLFYLREDSSIVQSARIDSFPYARRQILISDEATPNDFTAYALAVDTESVAGGEEAIADPARHAGICDNVRLFLDAHLKNIPEAADALTAMGSRFPARKRPPTEIQFRNLLRALEIDRALQVYEQLHAISPDEVILNEAIMNQVGYNLLGVNRVEDAVRIMRLNAETFPESPNVWDSYADACLASGDVATAIQCYRRVLNALQGDTVTEETLKEILKNIAERSLRQLEEDDN